MLLIVFICAAALAIIVLEIIERQDVNYFPQRKKHKEADDLKVITFEQLKDMLFHRDACSQCKIEGSCTIQNCIEWKNL